MIASITTISPDIADHMIMSVLGIYFLGFLLVDAATFLGGLEADILPILGFGNPLGIFIMALSPF